MDTRTQAMFNEAAAQRNDYANKCINLAGEIAVLRAENAQLKAKLAEFEPDQTGPSER